MHKLLPITALAFLLAGCLTTGDGGEVVVDEPKPVEESAASAAPPSPGAPAPSLGEAPLPPSLAGAPAPAPGEAQPPAAAAPSPGSVAMLPPATPDQAQAKLAPLPGPQAAAVGSPMLLSLFDGTEVGRRLKRTDLIYAERSGQESLEYYRSGTRGSWQNPDTGNSGAITPTRTYQRQDGVFCREFEQIVTAGGATERAVGTACRQPDATWRLARQ
jgi:surface antigen